MDDASAVTPLRLPQPKKRSTSVRRRAYRVPLARSARRCTVPRTAGSSRARRIRLALDACESVEHADLVGGSRAAAAEDKTDLRARSVLSIANDRRCERQGGHA